MNKVSENDGIPVELFQILKDDAVKVLHSVCIPNSTNLKNSAVATELEKVFIPIQKKGNPKNIRLPHDCLISQVSKVMLKILQARLQQYLNHELPDVKLNLEKAEE